MTGSMLYNIGLEIQKKGKERSKEVKKESIIMSEISEAGLEKKKKLYSDSRSELCLTEVNLGF